MARRPTKDPCTNLDELSKCDHLDYDLPAHGDGRVDAMDE